MVSPGFQMALTLGEPCGHTVAQASQAGGVDQQVPGEIQQGKTSPAAGEERLPPPEQYGLWMAFLAGEELCNNALGW